MGVDELERRSVEAAVVDAGLAVAEFDEAIAWLRGARGRRMEPLAVEVWVFDKQLARVLLVHHRWRGWVPPGGKVEPGETPREAALRELLEETAVRTELLPRPAAAAVRSYHPDWPVTLGLSYAASVDVTTPVTGEDGQPVAWMELEQDWSSFFPNDPGRIRRHARWLAESLG